MQVTGQILAVAPRIDTNTNAQMYWQAHGKTFYTFDMVVQGPSGQVAGEINSITPNVYPKQVGAEITVEPYVQNGFPKLKAISEQNRQPQQQQPQQNVNQPPAQNTYTPPSQAAPVNTVREDIQFAQALNLACEDRRKGVIEATDMAVQHGLYLRILQTRQFPPSMMVNTGGPQPTDTTDYSRQDEDEDIPF